MAGDSMLEVEVAIVRIIDGMVIFKGTVSRYF